jgi:hypothetical protein
MSIISIFVAMLALPLVPWNTNTIPVGFGGMYEMTGNPSNAPVDAEYVGVTAHAAPMSAIAVVTATAPLRLSLIRTPAILPRAHEAAIRRA